MTTKKSFFAMLVAVAAISASVFTSCKEQKCLLKIHPNLACKVFIDGELKTIAEAKDFTKLPLNKGSYYLEFVSVENEDNKFTIESYTIADTEQLLNVTLHEIDLDIDVYIDGVLYNKQQQSDNHSKGYHCVDVKTTIGLDESQYSSVRWTDTSGALLSTKMWLEIQNLQTSATYKCYLTTGTDGTGTINH
jgi:hypothetical protein